MSRLICRKATKAAGSGGLFVMGDANCLIYIAMHTVNCCYANKAVASGIRYT